MDSPTNRLRSSKEILDAVIEKLQAITLDGADGSQSDAPAFERVEMFDLSDFQDALKRLALNQARTALVIWTGDDYESTRETSVLTTRRTQSIDIFVAERRLDSPVAALMGDLTSPGVLGLRDKVVGALEGVLLDSNDTQELLYLAPQSVERGIINADDKKENPGRQILILNWQASGEWYQTAVGSNDTY